jgi:hypothetical protein
VGAAFGHPDGQEDGAWLGITDEDGGLGGKALGPDVGRGTGMNDGVSDAPQSTDVHISPSITAAFSSDTASK